MFQRGNKMYQGLIASNTVYFNQDRGAVTKTYN